MTDTQLPASRWPFTLYRALVSLEAVMLITQAALAGGFLSGHFEALAMHESNASALSVVNLVATVFAVLLHRKGSGPAWPAWMNGALVVVIPVEHFLGIQRILTAHIPLALLIMTSVAYLLAWSWRTPLPSQKSSVVAPTDAGERIGAAS